MVCGGVPRGGPLALFWALLFLEWGGPAPDVVPQDPQHGGVGWGSYPPWVLRSGTPPGRTPLNKKSYFLASPARSTGPKTEWIESGIKFDPREVVTTFP